MIRFRAIEGERLSVGRLWGQFDKDRTVQEIGGAYRRGDLRPGEDRVTLIDPEISPARIPVSDLSDIQRAVARFEQLGGNYDQAFRSVFVCLDNQFSIAVYVYVALWEAQGSMVPQFHCVETLAEAGALLGRSDVILHVGALSGVGRH